MEIDESKIIEDNNEELALAVLLANQVVFLNNAKLSVPNSDVWNTVVYVNCNDVFLWACADAEPISNSDGDEGSEIIELYKLFKENPMHGPTKWVCKKRNLQPQKPLKQMMIKDGYWDSELESLTANS
jgi:hypothetical protein